MDRRLGWWQLMKLARCKARSSLQQNEMLPSLRASKRFLPRQPLAESTPGWIACRESAKCKVRLVSRMHTGSTSNAQRQRLKCTVMS
jgi:hypothetical protein